MYNTYSTIDAQRGNRMKTNVTNNLNYTPVILPLRRHKLGKVGLK